MGTQVSAYCDGCGTDIGAANFDTAIQVNAVGSNGTVTQLFLCIQPEKANDHRPVPGEEAYDPNVAPYTRYTDKITGCARKVLSKAVLGRLYEDVAAVTGDPDLKPFPL